MYQMNVCADNNYKGRITRPNVCLRSQIQLLLTSKITEVKYFKCCQNHCFKCLNKQDYVTKMSVEFIASTITLLWFFIENVIDNIISSLLAKSFLSPCFPLWRMFETFTNCMSNYFWIKLVRFTPVSANSFY